MNLPPRETVQWSMNESPSARSEYVQDALHAFTQFRELGVPIAGESGRRLPISLQSLAVDLCQACPQAGALAPDELGSTLDIRLKLQLLFQLSQPISYGCCFLEDCFSLRSGKAIPLRIQNGVSFPPHRQLLEFADRLIQKGESRPDPPFVGLTQVGKGYPIHCRASPSIQTAYPVAGQSASITENPQFLAALQCRPFLGGHDEGLKRIPNRPGEPVKRFV